MASREAKAALFDAIARVGRAVGSGRRLEILEALANGERSVERLAEVLELPGANVSRHLQVLRQAGLVAARRDGPFVRYRLASPEVFRFLRALRVVAASQVAEVRDLARAYLGQAGALEPVGRDELARRIERGEVVVIDVRPREEYEAGHVPGALSVPLPELRRRLRAIPRDREVIAYCRGPLCAFSGEAVALLRSRGYRARRLEDGLPEWAEAGFPVERVGGGSR